MFSLYHISLSPVRKSGRRSGVSSGTGSCGNRPGWRRIALRCVFLRLIRYWDEVAAVPTKLSCGCFDNVGPWGWSWLNDSSCSLFVLGVYPHWLVIRKGSQVLDSVSFVIGGLLLLLPLFVLSRNPFKWGHSGLNAIFGWGMSVFRHLPIRSSAGLRLHQGSGVAL